MAAHAHSGAAGMVAAQRASAPGSDPDAVPAIVTQAITGGVTVVQLRDKHATKPQIRQRAQVLKDAIQAVRLFQTHWPPGWPSATPSPKQSNGELLVS